MRRRQTRSAEIRALEVSLLGAPRDREALRRLAEAYAQTGVFHERALKTFERVLEDDAGRPDLQRAMSIAHLVRNVESLIHDTTTLRNVNPTGIDENIHLLQGWVDEYPQSGDLLKALGDLYMMRGQFADAEEAYRAARRHGFRPVVSILETIQTVSDLTPITGRPALYFGELAKDNGRDDLAELLLRHALRLPECRMRSADLLCDILERRRGRLRSRAEREALAWELARLRLDRGDLAGVIAFLEQVDLRRGADVDFVRTVARRLIEVGDYRQAFDYLSRLPLEVETKQLIQEISEALERLGENDTAAYVMEFINDNDPAVKEARRLKERELEISTELGLADLHYGQGRYGRALDRYLAALRMGYIDDGRVCGRIEEICDLAAADIPLPTLLDLAEYFESAGDATRALLFLRRVLDAEPSDLEIRQRLRRQYERGLSKNPNQPVMRVQSGDLFLLDDDPGKAVAEYRYASQFPQTEKPAQRRLAAAYARNGDLRPALECFNNMTLEGDDFERLYELALRLEEARLYRDALDALALIIHSDENFRDARKRSREIEERLQQGGDDVFADPRMRDLIGDQAVGRYRYIEQIGSGGMGSVHKVFDIKANQLVAMKVLRDGLTTNSKAVDRFFREARVAATLNHRNIVSICDYSINSVHGRSYIVMELVDGPSLRERVEDRLDRGHQLTLDDITEDLLFSVQLCDALQTTHQRGIIHRDIKPDNVMLHFGRIVKITDFGIMHVEEATFTPTGALIGTPRYMSPEQVQGGKIDGRSDIYSVGVILYELMVGSPPFVSGDIAYQQVHVQPTPPIEINPIIPQEVNAIILRALEKDRDLRYENADALRRDIERTLEGPLSPITQRILDEWRQTD